MGNRLSQIATRTGDNGTTGLGNNQRVSKNSLRVHAMGDVDELNSHIGLLLCEPMPEDVRALLVEVQHQLFNLGGELSIPGFELLKPEAVLALDEALAEHNAQLPKLQEFILPAGTRAASLAHVCRTVARRAERQVVALGNDETFLASDALAVAGTANRIIYLEEGDVVQLTRTGATIRDVHDVEVQREERVVEAHAAAVELGPFRHFMQKEIFEQPRALGDTLEGIAAITPELFGDNAAQVFADIDSILILACGTSYYSGCTAKYWLESVAKIPTQIGRAHV